MRIETVSDVDQKDNKSSSISALIEIILRLGIDSDIDEIRRRYALPQGEPSSDTLIAIANDLGVEARSMTVKFVDLPELTSTLPAILRSKGRGALVLEGVHADPVKGTIAVVREPSTAADALVAVDEARLAEVWEGEVILLKRRYSAVDENQPFGLGWLVSQVLRERKLFLDIAMGAIVNTIFTIAPAFLMIIILNRVLVNHSYSTLNVLVGAIALIILFETVLGYLRRLMTQVATTRIDGRINLYMMDKLLQLPMDYFERNATGKTLSKLGKVTQIRNFLTGQLFGAVLDTVPLIGLVPALLIIQWRLALFVFAMTAIIALIIFAFMKPVGRRYSRVIRAEQKRNAYLVETIHGMRTIKSLALEGRRRRDWDLYVAEATAARHDLSVMANNPQTLSHPFDRLIYSGTMVLGAFLVLYDPESIAVGTLVGFSMLSMRLAAPLLQIARLQQDLAEVRGAVNEVASIMNYPPEESRLGSGLRLPIKGEIRFQDVSFRYETGSALALDKVSVNIPQGKMLGIMGRSGSGKTTVTRLLQGLHSNYEGMIKIDGMDLREIELSHLRTNIGVVPQENFLFSGSIRDNIGMARPNATLAEIIRAAQLAGAEEFIERLPRGYDTVLEEGAVNLSGGQRQRLAIARALLIDPAVLILDEATSALDAESESIVNSNLKRIAKGRTVISISHRLSMLVDADAILVLERGKVYDIGTQVELMERCDIYQHLWYTQNRHLESKTHPQLISWASEA